MLAKYIKADECIIFTDVEGIYTTDPRQHKKAKKIGKIFYDEMLEMASLGSKVMQPTSVQDAKITIEGVKDKPGVAASIFKPLSQNLINVDMVVQNISSNGKETDLTFTIKSDDLNKTKKKKK